MLHRRQLLRLETASWIAGTVLVIGTVAFGAAGALAGKMDLAQFERARAAAWRGYTEEAPVQELWSQKRVRDFQESLAKSIGEPLAVLRMPSLDLVVPIYGEDDEIYLNRGAGVVEGLSLPGKGGNLGVASHRDGYFRVLKDVKRGDPVFVELPKHVMEYRVDEIHIVDKADLSLLQETDDHILTLITCHPFYFIGNAPQRYIVRASFVRTAALAPPQTQGVENEDE